MPKETWCGAGSESSCCPVAALGAAAAAAPAVVQVVFGDDPVSFTGETHAYSVGFSALVAACAASGLTILGARRADTRTVLVGTAFAVMAALLALHGFATPGVWFGPNGVVAITGGATLPAGAVILALSAFPLPRGLRTVRPLLVLQARPDRRRGLPRRLGARLAEPPAAGPCARTARLRSRCLPSASCVRPACAARAPDVPAHAARARPGGRGRPRVARDARSSRR